MMKITNVCRLSPEECSLRLMPSFFPARPLISDQYGCVGLVCELLMRRSGAMRLPRLLLRFRAEQGWLSC